MALLWKAFRRSMRKYNIKMMLLLSAAAVFVLFNLTSGPDSIPRKPKTGNEDQLPSSADSQEQFSSSAENQEHLRSSRENQEHLRSSADGQEQLPASADSQDAFSQLLALLEQPAAPPVGCRQPLEVGGRCFRCWPGSTYKFSQTDGSKPVCLPLLPANCSVLSFGINHDFSFDAAMEDLGCTVHSFDPTMGVASFRRSAGIYFHSLGIGAEDTEEGRLPLASLDTIVRHVGLERGVIDYLKLDVESSEWTVLEQQLETLGPLLRVRQLAVELHLQHWDPTIGATIAHTTQRTRTTLPVTPENAARFVKVLTAIRDAGFSMAKSKRYAFCQKTKAGCLATLYEVLWVNTRFSM